MNKLVTFSLVLLVALVINGCKKEPADTPQPPPTDTTEPVAQKPEASLSQSEKSEVTTVAEKDDKKRKRKSRRAYIDRRMQYGKYGWYYNREQMKDLPGQLMHP